MCTFCTPSLDRRTILRHAIIGGSVLAASPLWVASLAHSATGVVGSARIPDVNTRALSPPAIVSRRQWGANEMIRANQRQFAPVRKLIVHHTASPNNPRNPLEVVRFIQTYYTLDRKYGDTGYNFIIDHKGVIYEGRASRRYSPGEPITGEDSSGWGVVGAHAKNNNAGSCGICLIGDFDTASPTDAALASLTTVLAWKANRHRIDATRSDTYVDIHGKRRTYPNISGHRQIGETLCPGKRLFALLPTIRTEVVYRAGHWAPITVDVPAVIRQESGALR